MVQVRCAFKPYNIERNEAIVSSLILESARHDVVRGGGLGFSVLRFWPFFRSVFRFLHLRFFGFGVCCGLRFFRFLAFGFRFSAKIQAVFRIWYLMWFSFFPIWFPVMRLNRVGGRASRITPGALTLH